MAKRMSATDLKEIIRGVVREEIRDTVVRTISEVLSERYMKGIVREALDRRVSEITERQELLEQRLQVQGDEPEPEVVPEVLGNDDEGIYQQSPLKRESSDDILPMFFEDTRPIPAGPLTGPMAGMPDISSLMNESPAPTPVVKPTTVKNKPAADVSRWKKLVEGANQRAIDKRPIVHSPEQLEKELEMKRKALEVPVK